MKRQMLCCVVGSAARRGGMRHVSRRAFGGNEYSEMPRRNTATSDGAALVAYLQFPLKLFADG